MTLSLDCPVCSYKDVPGDSCPNCDTDLSTLRLLLLLPEMPTVSAPVTSSKWRIALIALLVALVSTLAGASLAFTFGRFPEMSQALDPTPTGVPPTGIPAAPTPTPIPSPESAIQAVLPMNEDPLTVDEPELFFSPYKVRAGDTLGGIASRYGVQIEEVTQVNPQLQGREDRILVGESLYLPLYGLNRIPDGDE